jgi:hypothetical protein
METNSSPRVIVADRFDRGVIIEFDDGKRAFYPAFLLYEILPQAQPITEADNDPPPQR